MKIYHLSQDGLHKSEKDALNRLEKGLPKEWFGFSSLEMFDRNEGSFETDLILLTHDRLIVVELKKWSGKLYSRDGNWVIDWGNRQEIRKNPIKQVRRAAQILNTKLLKKLKGKSNTFNPFVDNCIVLCGTADKSALPDDEKEFVYSVEEFIDICSSKKYSKHFPTGPSGYQFLVNKKENKPFNNYKLFKDFFINNSVDFKPKTFCVNNFSQSGAALFSHRDNIYSEYLSQRVDDSNYKALMRKWDFFAPAIAHKAQTAEERSLIGYRESKVLGYIDAQDESLQSIHLELTYVPSPDDVSSDFVELYKWPGNRLRLDEFMARNGDKLTEEGRADLIKVFVSHLAQLHEIDVAHRDIGKHSVWVSLPSKVTFSNFLTASYPDPNRQSVRSVRDILKSGRIQIPEDLYEDKDGTPFTRDVYLAGAIVHYIAFSRWPTKLEDGTYEWCQPDVSFKGGIIDSWLKCCLDIEAKNRFSTMSIALDQLNRLLDTSQDRFNSNAELQKYISDTNVYMVYMPSLVKQKSATSALYQSHDKTLGICLWHGVSQFTADKRTNVELATFLERINSLKNSSQNSLLEIKEFGYNPSMQNLFVVYKWIEGDTWENWFSSISDIEEAKSTVLMLLKQVSNFHRCQFIHGDIHPQNVIIREEDGEPILIDLFEYQQISTDLPYNTNYLPKNYEHIGLEARDRYAIVKMVMEVAEKVSLLNLQQYCVNVLDLQEVSEGELLRLIDNFSDIVAPKPIVTIKSYPVLLISRFMPKFSEMESDDGTYYLTIKVDHSAENKTLKVFISGVKHQLDLHIDADNRKIKRIFARDAITHHQFISHKRKADAELEGVIRFEEAPFISAEKLVSEILNLESVKQKLLAASEDAVPNSQVSGPKRKILTLKKASQLVSSRNIWKALVDTEVENLPKVTIAKEPEILGKNEVAIRFVRDSQGIDFDLSQEKVHVKLDTGTKMIPVGRLVEIGRDTLRISNVRRLNFGPGDQLRLESSQSAASLAKRQKAIDNILNDRAVIPDLVDYFDINKEMQERVLNDEPSDEEMDAYNVANESGDIVFSLNKQQRDAFKKLFQFGPISLLQGPPGTGKTSFISSFIHYAAIKGASKILLVSQSHEAVNNAAEKVRKLFQAQGQSLTVVRLGDEPNVSAPLLDVHEIALQNHYRELFRAEFKTRLSAIVTSLALPKEFIDLAIEFESTFGMKFSSLSKAYTKLDDETNEILKTREGTIREKFMSWLERNGFQPQVFEMKISSELKDTFYYQLANKYDVLSKDSIIRFQQVVELSKEWLEVMSSRNAHFQNFLTKTRTLVCGTCVGIGRNHYGINENIYDWVIIDEAARSTSSELAIAMQIGKRILLVGDHKQLPPTYEDEHLAAAHRKIPKVNLDELRQSDFERSFYSSYGRNVGQTLLTQYRMAKPIGRLVSECFYDKKLESGRTEGISEIDFSSTEFDKAVVWVDTSDAGQMSKEKKPTHTSSNVHSVVNQYEINLIIGLIFELISKTNINEIYGKGSQDESPIGVICMYAEQQKLMIREMNSLSWASSLLERRLLKVDTVDSYQGKENDIVILSLVRNNNSFTEGFLSSENRANVALSRAKEKLFIVGASHMWSDKNSASAFGRVLSHVVENDDCAIIASNVVNKDAN